jgi:hypothetical protein
MTRVEDQPKIFEISVSWLLCELLRRISEDGCHPAVPLIDVDEGSSVDVIMACPADRKGGVRVLDLGRLRIAIACEWQG